MRPFTASIQTVVMRFYLMMAVVFIGGFTGQLWLLGFALPIFLLTILGISFGPEPKVKTATKQITIGAQQRPQAA